MEEYIGRKAAIDEDGITDQDKHWLELLQAVIEGKMSDAEANQSWYEYINEREDMRGGA